MTDEPKLKDEPSEELEQELERNPEDEQLKVDVGSDESMDASDPISTTLPGDGEPHPSSDAPNEE